MSGYALSNVSISGSTLVNCRIRTAGLVSLRVTKTVINDSSITLEGITSPIVRLVESEIHRSTFSDFRLGHSLIAESTFDNCLVNNVDTSKTTISRSNFEDMIIVSRPEGRNHE